MHKVSWIKEKSKELEIPFSHVLTAFVLETTAEIFLELEKKEDFWLQDVRVFGLDTYKKRESREIAYFYRGGESLLELADDLLASLKKSYQKAGILLDDGQVEKKEDEIKIILSLFVDEMYVPFAIHVKKAPEEVHFANEQTIRLFLENNKSVTVKTYPYEQMLASYLVEILEKLELLQEMDRYSKAYDIIDKYPLEGRKVQEGIRQILETQGKKISGAAWETFAGYGNYSYMKKKWKVLLRQEKRKEPTWEAAHEKIKNFLEPMWPSIEEDTIFFGDWMPDLGRFLD